MDSFKSPELSDRLWVNEILSSQHVLNCDAPFGATYIWHNEYGTKICRFKDFYLTAYTFDEGRIYFDYPIGNGNVEEAVEFMKSYALAKGLSYSITACSHEQVQVLRSILPSGEYSEHYSRDNAEYIYLSERLAELKGRKLHSKRNHIANFKKIYNYTTEMLCEKNFEDALMVNDIWCNEHGGHNSTGETGEDCAIRKAFKDFNRLGFSGMLLRVDGKPVAMTMGEPISDECYVVHFEKAISGINGAYTAINNFFSKTLTKYKYINREEDMGIEGLRRAKLSYGPEILLEKLIFSNICR